MDVDQSTKVRMIGGSGIAFDVVLVVCESILRALDVFNPIVHVELVIECLGDDPSSMPVGSMENDCGFHICY